MHGCAIVSSHENVADMFEAISTGIIIYDAAAILVTRHAELAYTLAANNRILKASQRIADRNALAI